MEDGFLAGSGVSSLGVAWADFGASLASNDTPLVVASYVHADAHLVTNLHADAGLGTCRRRLLQQR